MTRSRRFIHFLDRHLTALLGLALFVVTFLAYASTVPSVQVFGDPSEYTFIPWILGIAIRLVTLSILCWPRYGSASSRSDRWRSARTCWPRQQVR